MQKRMLGLQNFNTLNGENREHMRINLELKYEEKEYKVFYSFWYIPIRRQLTTKNIFSSFMLFKISFSFI